MAKEKHDHREDPPLSTLSQRFIAHAKQPFSLGKLENANGRAKGVGTCGDSIEIFLVVNGEKIKVAKHVPNGCVYTTACASAVITLVQGRSLDKVLQVTAQDVADELGGLPEDHMHCAALAVNTLGEAVDNYYQKVWGKKRRHG